MLRSPMIGSCHVSSTIPYKGVRVHVSGTRKRSRQVVIETHNILYKRRAQLTSSLFNLISYFAYNEVTSWLYICIYTNKTCTNVAFNNNSVISWRLVLLVEETGGPGENYRLVASYIHNKLLIDFKIYFNIVYC